MSDSLSPTILAPDTLQAYERLPEGCGYLRLEEYGILELTGDDRKAWLQGQVTNDLRKIDIGASIAFCVCTPTGQLVSDCEMWVFPARFLATKA